MAYQSEAALEQQFIEQLNKQEYSTVDIPDYDALVENFKVQFEAFNAAKLDTPLTDKEWERIFYLMLGKSVFQSAKILRDKFVLEREDGTKVYLSFFDNDHTKNIFQVTNQTTVVGKYVNRYDVTILVNGLPLIQIELKRRGIDIREAVNQVMRGRQLCPHVGLCPAAPCSRYPVGQQEVHEHEALGGGSGRRLYCWLTSFSQSLQTNLRITLDGTARATSALNIFCSICTAFRRLHRIWDRP